jgi:type I restriction enzyme, S subunit
VSVAGGAFIARFRDLDRWITSKRRSVLTTLHPDWSIVKVGEIVRQVAEKVKVDANTEYKLIGVRWYGEGTFHRETVMGDALSATYLTPVIPSTFIYNRLFAWKASFAVVPPEHEGHFVSSEFPQFIVDPQRILPEYLYLFFMLDSTVAAVNAASVGSAAVSRNRFKEEEFVGFEIPLPPLETQRAIVARWQAARVEADAAAERVKQVQAEIESRFLCDLGLEASGSSRQLRAFAVSWRELVRWSVSHNQATQSGADLTHGKHPVVELGAVLEMIQYGTSEKANSSGNGTPVIRMNNIVDGSLDLSDMKYVDLSPDERKRLVLQDGDILFNRTNSKELVGKCAVFHERGEYVFASYLIRVRPVPSKATPDFLVRVINSPIGRQQINALSRQIIGQANVNSVELRSLQIPLPPLDIQRAIVARIQAGRAEIARLRGEAEYVRRTARVEVEALILGTLPVAGN